MRFTAHLAGVQGAPGVFGRANLSQHFRIGNSLVVVANTATHYMKVWWKGRKIGNWPISTGRPGMDTADGRYLSFDMANPVDMNSATIGIPAGSPGYYNELVYDAVQFTMSGTYIHSAPWSVGEQGIVNVSHGCVNLGPANAVWYYDHSMLGDPISVVGSPVRGTWNNGWTIYFLSWHKLLAGSATGDAVLASASGSQFVPRATRGAGHRVRAGRPGPGHPARPADLARRSVAGRSPPGRPVRRLAALAEGRLARLAGRHRGPLGLVTVTVAVAVPIAVPVAGWPAGPAR